MNIKIRMTLSDSIDYDERKNIPNSKIAALG